MSDTRFGLLSGAAWGIAVSLLISGLGRVGPSPATLLLYTPVGAVVGFAVVVALRRVCLNGALRIAAVSLCSLLAAAAAFGMVQSLVPLAALILAGHTRPDVLFGVLISPIYWLWGLVATGLVIPLWPLSALNHWWLGRLRARASHAS